MTYEISALFELLKKLPPYPEQFEGRGIVISAGGYFLPSAYVAVRSLRAAGCSLPIQIWHLGEVEFPEALHRPFLDLGAQPVDANEIRKIHPMRCFGGWQSKPFSILHSPFKEVFSFDADNMALLNPEPLFSCEEYKRHGSMFWPDFHSAKWEYWMIKPQAWGLLGLEPKTGEEIETGQLLIDKERNWEALAAAFHMNANSDFFYEQCSYGDTDTYTLAWMLLRKERFLIPHQPLKLDDMVRIHFTPDGKELFQHSRKWLIPAAQNKHLKTYRNEPQCLEWIRDFDSALEAARAGR